MNVTDVRTGGDTLAMLFMFSVPILIFVFIFVILTLYNRRLRKNADLVQGLLVKNGEFQENPDNERTLRSLLNWRDISEINWVVSRPEGSRQVYVADIEVIIYNEDSNPFLYSTRAPRTMYVLNFTIPVTIPDAGTIVLRKDGDVGVNFLKVPEEEAPLINLVPNLAGLLEAYRTPGEAAQRIFSPVVVKRVDELFKSGHVPYVLVITKNALSITCQRIHDERVLWEIIAAAERLAASLSSGEIPGKTG